MPDTTLRQITMLSLVPRRPPGITTEALRSELGVRDFDVSLRTMTLHPLALVVRDSVHYLLATVWDFTDIRQLVLHRMSSARLLDEAAQEPQDFDLDDYIREGGFDYSSGEEIKLVARFDAFAGKALQETPLTPKQTHKILDDGRIEVHATVNDSEQLRWWLMGFGSGVEVVGPAHLREYMRKDFERLVQLYSNNKH